MKGYFSNSITTCTIFLAVFSLLLFSLEITPIKADEEDPPSCEDINGCVPCLSSENGCIFAVGRCFSDCGPEVEGATCYSTDAFDDDAERVCELFVEDNILCASNSNCEDCTSSVKNDGSNCQWYQAVGACFGGGTGPFGTGSLECPSGNVDNQEEEEPPTASPTATTTTSPTATPTKETPAEEMPAPTPTTNAPTVPQTTEAPEQVSETPETASPTEDADAGPDVECRTWTTCEECVSNGCAYAPTTTSAGCVEDCSLTAADSLCYSLVGFEGIGAEGLCEIQQQEMEMEMEDSNTCMANSDTDCETCTSTQLSDPDSTCYWYADTNTCTTTNCNEDTCGRASCSTTPANVCQAATGTCSTCLEAGCAWLSFGFCVPLCTDNADNSCFSTVTYPNTPSDVICEAASQVEEGDNQGQDDQGENGEETDNEQMTPTPTSGGTMENANAADKALCTSKNYCFTCTSTVKSDMTTCHWYTDGENEWCDVGGCTEDGICGTDDSSFCEENNPSESSRPDEETEQDDQTPFVPPTDPPSAAFAIGGIYQNGVAMLVVGLLALWMHGIA